MVFCFFGDGASNQGSFHEALNMAALWRLPVVFVCENNRYGMSTSTERSMSVRDVADRAPAYGIPARIVDGNRFADVADAAFEAIDRARDGGPSLIESKTYRIRGHSRSDRNRYRTREEIEEWSRRDPIVQLETELAALGIMDRSQIEAIHREASAEIEAAIAFAAGAAEPDPADLLVDVVAA